MSEYSAEAKRLETSKHGDKYETLELISATKPPFDIQ
jgi:hypothetical protein